MPPAEDLVKIVSDAIVNFRGTSDELESAIGMLFLGHAFGWRIMYMVHSMATVRKYERILGIVAKDVFPESTELSNRSLAYKAHSTISNFWKAVKGEKRPEGFTDRAIN
ncbi:MAG: hypothetical protein JSS42_15230 [Proteobacteria bacterium]|nr:hypothetical protein [Pseudomonadota bacterium]